MADEEQINNAVKALGRVASGIFIVTIREPSSGNETGMLCSWVMQAGFAPPAISLAIKKGRYVLDWLDDGAPFAVNIVADRGKSLLSHFGKGFEPGESAFVGISTDQGPHGLPLLTDDIVGHLICKPQGHLDSSDHRVYLAEVVAGSIRDDESPMVHIRNSGQHY